MKKITGIFFTLTLSVIGIYTLHATSNMGFNVTGAPGEGSCATCHIGNENPDNFGSINIWVNGDNKNTTFIPDSTYDIEVISAHPGTTKFGFALSARYKGVEFINAGTFLSAGESGLIITDYVTHDSTGNQGNLLKKWKFKWKAPKNPAGNSITFYAAGVMADNDQSTRGDKVYLDSLTMIQNSNGIDENNWKSQIQVMQSPDDLNILSPYPIIDYSLHDIEGKLIKDFFQENNKFSLRLPLTKLSTGIYIVSIRTEKGFWSRKIFTNQ